MKMAASKDFRGMNNFDFMSECLWRGVCVCVCECRCVYLHASLVCSQSDLQQKATTGSVN